jgi:putative membrane protein
MINNSLGRILLLLKGDWMINRRQHILVAIIFMIVIWFIELVPLAFSRSFTEWEKAIYSIDPSFFHFAIARILYLFAFLSWVSNTLYYSRIPHFYLAPLSSLEKYLLILFQGVVMSLLATVVAVLSLIPYLLIFSPNLSMALSHIVPFLGENMQTPLDIWQHILFVSLVSVLIVGLFFFRILIRNQVIATLAASVGFILIFVTLLPLLVEFSLENYITGDLYEKISTYIIASVLFLFVDIAMCVGGYYIFKKKQIQ